MTYVYDGANVLYFLVQEEGQYDVDTFLLPKDLMYKDIPLTLYVRIKNVMDRDSVFITWDHNGTNVKYLPCLFERSMSWMSPIFLRTCTRTSQQNFKFMTQRTVLTQYDIY
jgi:hypothetical protein